MRPVWLLFCVAAISSGADRLSPEQPELLSRAVSEAQKSGAHRLAIPAGTYRIRPPVDGPHLQFTDLSDFEIDARGVSLIFTDQTRRGIEFRRCRNVRFRGAKLAYEIPPFSQGAVEGMAPDGSWYDVRIERGYPTNLDDPKYFSPNLLADLFDPKSRSPKPKTYDLYAGKIQRTGRDGFRIFWSRPSGPELHPVSTGDLIAFRGVGEHSVTMTDCARMELTDITIYNAGAFAVWEFAGEGENRYNLTVKRGPRPRGAINDPLWSSNADAFHSTSMRKGPVLDNCNFEGMGDDGIAIHGFYSFVFEAHGNSLTINQNSFRPGDPLRLLDSAGRSAGDAVVESVRARPDFVNTRKSARKTRQDDTAGPYFEISLDRPLPAGFDYLASNPAASGSGYVVRKNHIGVHRARGMVLKAEDGLIEDNVIDGSSMAAIVLSPEVWWNEASYSRNVVVRGNIIRHVAYVPGEPGAVVIGNTDTPVEGCGHQHISFEKNVFRQMEGTNLYLTSACDVGVAYNRFDDDRGTSPVIRLIGVREVHLESNKILAPTLERENPIEVTASTQVEGVETGVELCAQSNCP